MLAEAGRRDLVVAYPTVDRHAISRLAELAHADPAGGPGPDGRRGRAARPDRGRGRRRAGADPGRDRHRRRLPGARAAAIQAGPKRSPIRTAAAARAFAEEIASRPGLRAGRADGLRGPGRRRRRRRPRTSRSATSGSGGCSARRWPRSPSAGPRSSPRVSAVAPLRFVNGGGTGSLELTSARGRPSPSSPPAPASTPRRCSTTTAASRCSRPPASRCRSSAARHPAA